MPRRVAVSTLNASTIDILNTIRANAPLEYQNLVPEVEVEADIPKVGDVLYGYPALANYFISALVNRIAMVRVKSATFNNAYAELKKGYLEYGETVEEVFVQIAKAREFSAEKAKDREFKRTLPDVKAAFHTMNYRVQYPITIQDEDLRMAFLDPQGVEDLIAKIVGSVDIGAEYDEYLLFKYLMIKAIAHGKMKPVSIGDGTNMNDAAVQYRGISNMLTFIKTDYNEAGVHTNTSKDDQYIFMDAQYNAAYDVNVLASAFNMDKAEFMGKLKLIDDWTTFDNERFDQIRAGSDQIEEVTASELALMADVKAVLVDREWFQIYDNLAKMTEDYVASGLYWNYFYNVWKTVSYSPFSNAVVFVASTVTPDLDALTFTVDSVSRGDDGVVITLVPDESTAAISRMSYKFIQTEDDIENMVAVHPYGAYVVPASSEATTITPTINLNGTVLTASAITIASVQAGATVSFTE